MNDYAELPNLPDHNLRWWNTASFQFGFFWGAAILGYAAALYTHIYDPGAGFTKFLFLQPVQLIWFPLFYLFFHADKNISYATLYAAITRRLGRLSSAFESFFPGNLDSLPPARLPVAALGFLFTFTGFLGTHTLLWFSVGFRPKNENEWNQLGVVGGMGFFFLVALVFVVTVVRMIILTRHNSTGQRS